MEVPLVLESSKLKISFRQQPPRLVRWGFHPSPVDPLMIGLTAEGELCRIEFTRKRKAGAILKAWKKAWPQTKFVEDKAATADIARRLFGQKKRVTLPLREGRMSVANAGRGTKETPSPVKTKDLLRKSKFSLPLPQGERGNKLKLHLTGTKFQQAVWKEMLKIPAGKVRSYADVARRIKNPKAVRAVGTACGANPIPLLVPCHRIVGSNGGLGGFGGGLPLKEKLLRSEGALHRAA